MVDVLIVGGGIAGLTTAYELTKRGVAFSLLEASPRLGGVILSEQVEGLTIDAGPDALLIQKPDGIALCRELGLGDRLVATKPPRLAYIQRGGRLHPLPAASVLGIPTRIGPFLRTGLFTWAGKLRMGAELFVPARRDDGDESIGAFMTRRFGTEARDYLAEPLLAGIHAGDVDRLSLGALFPRFVAAEREHGSLIRAFRRHRAAPSSEGAFKSLPGGLSEIVAALVPRLASGSACTDTPVTSIRREADAFAVETPRGVRRARAVVLSAPAHAAASMTGPLDRPLADLCREVPYTSIATVALAFPLSAIRHPLDGSGYVVPRVERSPILAATWLSSKWPGRAPEGTALLRTFIGGTRHPDAVDETDDQLVARSLDAIRPVLGITGPPSFARAYRFRRASAQHEVGHLERMKQIEARLATHPGLFVTGSGFRGVGIPDCVADARATAGKVVTWLA